MTTAIEHHAVLDPCRHLERQGFSVTVVPVEPNGVVDPEKIAAAITERTVLVSVMLANNEVGTIQPLADIGRITRARSVLLHTDAAQAIGRVAIDLDAMGIDLLSLSAHKIYGPKGVGALYVRSRNPRVRLIAQIDGGGHERGMRSGTLNVPGIVGLAKACDLMREEGVVESALIRILRDRLYTALVGALGDGVVLNGDAELRLPGNLNVSFQGVASDALIAALPGLAVSSGSACTSGDTEPSHVILALGIDRETAKRLATTYIGSLPARPRIASNTPCGKPSARHIFTCAAQTYSPFQWSAMMQIVSSTSRSLSELALLRKVPIVSSAAASLGEWIQIL